MATDSGNQQYSYGVNDALAVKVWAKKLFVESLKSTILDKFIGTDNNSAIQVKDDLSKGSGDKITYGLRMQLGGDGTIGDSTLEGNEEALTTFTDKIYIDQLRHAVKVVGNMSQQRVNFDIRAEAQSGLVDWWADRMDVSYINQLSSNENAGARSDLTVATAAITGLNSIDPVYVPAGQATTADAITVTPSVETRGVLPTAVGSKSEAVALTTWTKWEEALAIENANDSTSGAHKGKGYFQLSMLDGAVVKARTLKTPIRPIKLNGMECYVAILHPYQILDLRRNTNNGQWMDIQKSAMMGGQITNNPIFTGAIGMYNGVIIHEDARIPRAGADSKTSLGSIVTTPDTGANPSTATTTAQHANVTRGIFLGAQSGCIAFGRSYGLSGSNVKFKWTEVLNDYENQLGVSAALVYGCKKTVFDSKDFGTLVLSSISTGETTILG
jgi:N4-gp56 family major capsid protein